MYKLLKISLAAFSLFHIVNATDSIITLQNGLNGYNGCKDTYIQLGGYQTPHFMSDSILVGDYYCTT